MTVADWLTCANPEIMLESLRGKASDRKLRLFAVACCRRLWPSIKGEQFRHAVRVAELFADGVMSQAELGEAGAAAVAAFLSLSGDEELASSAAISAAGIPGPKKSFLHQLLDAVDEPLWEDEFDRGDPHAPALVTARIAAWAAAKVQGQLPFGSPAEMAERQEQARLLRDIFGKSSRPFSMKPGWLLWRDGEIPKMAKIIYDDRTFDYLPILANALQAAGCDYADILCHCRGPGPHVRGCWALDLVLGKK